METGYGDGDEDVEVERRGGAENASNLVKTRVDETTNEVNAIPPWYSKKNISRYARARWWWTRNPK